MGSSLAKGSVLNDAVRAKRCEVAIALTVACVVLVSGCASQPMHDSKAYAPTLPPAPVPVEQRQGAIYHETLGVSLFEDSRARRIGDVLTIVLVEKTTGTKKASQNTEKNTEVAMSNPTLFGHPLSFNMPGNKALDLNLGAEWTSDHKFEGSGDASLSNALNGSVTVTVADVMSNGYLLVRGEKRLTINQGIEYVQFSGIVRPTDIQADNTVQSTLVADAKITYTGDGDVNDATQMGAVTRFFNRFWPF
jgi:flagellar L-ring protein precursor FlgH